jgi:hypothetical protein
MCKLRLKFSPVKRGLVLRRLSSESCSGERISPGEETVAERKVGNEADAQLAQQRQELVLRIAGSEGIFCLQRGDGMHGVSTPDCGGASLGKADVADLAFDHQLGHGADGVLDGSLWIDPMLVV